MTDPQTNPAPSLPSIHVAVLGIGMMGLPMGRRLCEAGLTVSVWNRSRSKAERLQPFGARVADTLLPPSSTLKVMVRVLVLGLSEVLK